MNIHSARRMAFMVIYLVFLAGCAAPIRAATPTVEATAAATPSPTFTPTSTRTATLTESPTATATARPLTLVFYGDSVLKVGDANRSESVGFSIIDPLRNTLPMSDTLLVSNHGGMKAKWGSENLQQNVLSLQPDLVTLWWGMNDLGGCPGIFDRTTNQLLQYKLDAMLKEHLQYLRKQIDDLLAKNIPVILITPIPVLGNLPWSHFTADYQIVWENDRHCDFNLGLRQLVEAQRALAAEYTSLGKPVYLLDAWQIYQDNADAGKMYMDAVHPASHGAELIAQAWDRIFQTIDFKR